MKLTKAQRRKIAERYATCESTAAIAKDYGLTQQKVRDIARYQGITRRTLLQSKTWKKKVEKFKAEGIIIGWFLPVVMKR